MNRTHSDLDTVGALAESFLARYRRGERPSLIEYAEKYPELSEQIRELFPALVVMEELGSVEGAGIGTTPAAVPGKVPEQLGDYRILREVGRGGMGIVYEAVQQSLGRHVALKVLPAHGLLSPTHLERFRREARAAARLHHTNIVPVHGVGEHEGFHYYAMQFIQGQGLDEVLKEVKRLRGQKPAAAAEFPEMSHSPSLAQGLLSGGLAKVEASASTAVTSNPSVASTTANSASGSELTTQPEAQYFRSVAQMGVQVAGALDYAHKHAILHRDIKPSNLLLDTRGTVWVTDFGLAKAEDAEELSHTGDIVGTLRYMAPERFTGWSDPRSDVYGLGITVYEMLTLCPAFDESNRARLIERITQDDPPPLRKMDHSIPRDLETIVLKAIAKEPTRRYRTAAELADDLRRFLAGEPVRARRVSMWERGGKWVKRRPAVAALLAVSAAAVLVLIAGTLVHNAQLGVALQEARDNLAKAKRAEEQAELAEREKTRQLAFAHLSEARARRNSGVVGRRFESLEALKKAADVFRTIGPLDEDRTLELRNEAIACLALADLKHGPEWTPDPGWSQPLAFDPTLQYYVVRSDADNHPEKPDARHGEMSVRRTTDHQEVALLHGFGVRVVAAHFSPNGRYLAAHYESGQRHNYVWDLSRREAIVKVRYGTHEGRLAFSPDSLRVALPHPEVIEVWELPSGVKWKDLPPILQPTNLVQFHPDGRRLTAVWNRIVQLRDLSEGKVQATFKHEGGVASLAWRSDGKILATGGDDYDHNIYLWDVANPAQPLQILRGHFGGVVHLAFSHGGDLLLSESWDSTSRLWDARTGQLLLSRRWDGYRHQFGLGDKELNDGWQLATGRECRTFQGPKRLAWVAISPTGRLMASVSETGAQLWDLAAAREGDKLLATLPVGTSCTVHFGPKGESLITDSKRKGLQRWPIALDSETSDLRIGPPQSLGLSGRAPFCGDDPQFTLSADHRTVAHSPQPGQVLLYDLEDPGQKQLIESPRLRAPAFSPDGRWLATGNWQGVGTKVWDAQSGKLAHSFDLGEQEGQAAWATFSPDSKWLVTSTFAGYGFWEVGSWHKKRVISRENAGSSVGLVVFSPDGEMLALLHSMTEVWLVNPTTGRLFARLPATGTPYCFSPDGSQLVTYAGRDGAFQVWDLRAIRQQLKEMGLDWDLPPYPAPAESANPLRVQVLNAEPLLPSKELDAQAYFERGLLHVQLRSYSKAAADFKRAGELDHTRLPWEEAVRACSQVIEQNAQDAEAYHQRAHARERLGHWQDAIADHSQAIERAPMHLAFLVCRGKAYFHMGENDKAAADFRTASQDNHVLANQLAWELATLPNLLNREPTLAVDLARQAVRQMPGEPMYWNSLGVAHYRTGDLHSAVEALEEAERLAPDKYFGFNAYILAMCHHRLGDTAKAKDYFDRASRWCQKNRSKLSATHVRELQAFRADAESLLRAPPPAR
jgi:serine/threonine protein kinase/WD40 repeat protein/tetratricopeptide (TPR) repeat protein